MKFWKWLGWAIMAAVYWWLFTNADKPTQVGLGLGALIVYIYYELSKQISENHKIVARMLENTYRASAGLPRYDDAE